MNHTGTRLTAAMLTLGLVGALSGCGSEDSIGRILRGQDPAATTPASVATPAQTETTGLPTPTETSWSDTATPAFSETPSPDVTSSTPGTASTTDEPTSSPEVSSPPASATSAATTRSEETVTAQVDGRTITGVPAGLGFPPQVEIDGTTSFAQGGGSVVMAAPTEDEIFAFYRSALPNAGYRVVSDTAGTLTFTGRGHRGSLVGTGEGGVLTWTPSEG